MCKLTSSLGGLQFGVDANGNYGYIKAGADSVTPFKKACSVITLSSSYSVNVSSGLGTAKATFTLPSGKEYIGAGLAKMTFSLNAFGGCKNTFSISISGNKITASIPIGGNWGDATITGTVTLNVFVVDK